jgi:hypothetical protein
VRTFLLIPFLLAACGGDDHGSPVCEELGTVCHDVEDPMGVECHELGHAEDEAVCVAMRDECLAHCWAALDAGPPPDGGGPDGPPAPPDGGGSDAATSLMHQYTLGSGDNVETTLDLASGTSVDFSISASGTIDWNAHSHFGTTMVLAEGTGMTAMDSFTAAMAGEHYLFLDNPSKAEVTVDVTLTLDGEGTVTF